MARIRHIKISNFRGLRHFSWYPSEGVNCLIGAGDGGKSSVLDAIDLCLGARRYVTFSDADFFNLDVTVPLSIAITIGELDDGLKNMDAYGQYLRSYDAANGLIEDEPERFAETVLTLNLTVTSDLEPVYRLVSTRADASGQSRYLTWSDRVRLCPTRIGAYAENDLAWRRGSVLTKLSDEKAETSGALAQAARAARSAFGDLADKQLAETLGIVSATARELGISIGNDPKAMLDAHTVSFGGGTIALHSESGVPLKGLGTGSARLLVAGLQRKAAKKATVILVDEVEYGLEPHRIVRLLQSIGSKEPDPPLQAFLTTHSPVVVRELAAEQLTLLRRGENDKHEVRRVASQPGVQGTVRTFPEAFLASSVIVCEGASEVGFLRGLDQHRASQGCVSLTAQGVALVDAGGCTKIYNRAPAFMALGYRTSVFRDDDVQPDAEAESEFVILDGEVFKWRTGRSLEDELFTCFPADVLGNLLDFAIDLHSEATINDHIRSASNGSSTLVACRALFSRDHRAILARACTFKSAAWFKTVSAMEHIGGTIIGPAHDRCEAGFRQIVANIFSWIDDGRA